MKTFTLLFLALCAAACTCFSYNAYINNQNIEAVKQSAAQSSASETSPFASGYPPGQQLPNAGGYPPGQQPPNAGGYPPGGPQDPNAPPNTQGYPPTNLPKTHLCQGNKFSDEPEIFIGTDPPPGQTAGPGGKIRVWLGDEGAPKIAPNEKVDPNTGQITPGDRTALDRRGNGFFLWEPALYITPLTSANLNGPFSGDAEQRGKPYFPSQIKGDYNNNVNSDKGAGLKGPPVDGDYTRFENGPGGKGGETPGIQETFKAEYIWEVNSLGLSPGGYHVELVIHDGDDNLGIDCIALQL